MKWIQEELWAWTLALITILVLLHMMTSCSTTKYVEVPVTKYVTKHTTDIVRDSVYVRDSVSVWMKGDTVFKDRWRDRVRDLRGTLIVNDTVRDTITKPYYITKTNTVEKELTWFQKVMLGSGKVLWVAGILSVLVVIAKRKM